MNVTDVKIRYVFPDPDSRLKAIASIVIDGELAIHELRIINGIDRIFVAMPNRRSEDGRFQDIVHPICGETRNHIEDMVLAAYRTVAAQDAINPAS